MKCTLFYPKSLPLLLLIVILVTGCRGNFDSATPTLPSAADTAQPPTAAAASAVPTITSTEAPLAARVNGQGITLAEFESELALYQLASGLEPTEADRQRVLDNLIEQSLLGQSALEQGFSVDEAALQSRLEALENTLGGEAALAQWIDGHGYTTQSFQDALAQAISAAWMRDQITAAVPRETEQVHARQILVYAEAEAQDILALLQAGNDFGNLATQYDPVTGGDLGWFPRGYLPNKALEDAAFSLLPGDFSQVVHTAAGYHILQVIERDPLHPLTPDALLVLQTQALQDWLAEKWEQSEIQVLLP